MVILNECRIDTEGKHLVIEATVENLDYYENVYISGVRIDTHKTFKEAGPSDNVIFCKDFENLDDIVSEPNNKGEIEGCACPDKPTVIKRQIKHIKLILNEKDLGVSLTDNIFFVYIIAGGYPDPSCPCTMDNIYTRGIALYWKPLYNLLMGYIKELNSNCIIPKGFIDMILRFKAFKLALKTGHFKIAFDYWDKFFKNKPNIIAKRNCNCNGIIY